MNWEREGQAAVERLRRMLRFDTTNPPGARYGAIIVVAHSVS